MWYFNHKELHDGFARLIIIKIIYNAPSSKKQWLTDVHICHIHAHTRGHMHADTHISSDGLVEKRRKNILKRGRE